MRRPVALWVRLALLVGATVWLTGAFVVVAQRQQQQQMEDLRRSLEAQVEKSGEARERMIALEARVKRIEDLELAARLARIETYLLGLVVPVFLMGMDAILRLGGQLLAFKLNRS